MPVLLNFSKFSSLCMDETSFPMIAVLLCTLEHCCEEVVVYRLDVGPAHYILIEGGCVLALEVTGVGGDHTIDVSGVINTAS